MAITILAPAPAEPTANQAPRDDDVDSDFDSDGDVEMGDDDRPAKSTQRGHLVTPGELVTSDSQWMR